MPRQSSGPRLVRRKNKPNWFIRYIDEKSGKQKDFSTGTSNREEAEEKLAQFLSERSNLRRGGPLSHHQITVAQILDDYARYKMGSPSAERLSYSMIHLLGFWHNLNLNHVNVSTVHEYLKSRITKNRSQATVRRELVDLRSAINHAAKSYKIVPIAFPKLPKDSSPKKRWLSEREFARLLAAAKHNYRSKFTLRLFLIIAFYSGARKTAIMELTWKQINFDNKTIDFNQDHLEQNNKKRAFIPMPPEIERFLIRRAQRYAHLTSYVFHQKHNPSKRIKHIDKGFRAATKLAKLIDVTPHTLRHSRISLLLQNGEKPINVSNYVRVSQPTIDRVYGHHSDHDLREMSKRLGRSHKVRTSKSNERES